LGEFAGCRGIRFGLSSDIRALLRRGDPSLC
jgi:hypothetical protein